MGLFKVFLKNFSFFILGTFERNYEFEAPTKIEEQPILKGLYAKSQTINISTLIYLPLIVDNRSLE